MLTFEDRKGPLLKFHRACCLVLSASGVAEYVEQLLDDADCAREDGVLASDEGVLMLVSC